MSGGHFDRTLVDNVDWIDGRYYRIRQGFRYYLTEDEGAEFVDVPTGFVTNFASTPRIVWPIFPPTGSYSQAAVVHDKLFLAPVIRSTHSARPCRFEETPGIFRDAAKACGTSRFVRRVMYGFLQIGSRGPWDEYRRKDWETGSTTVYVGKPTSDALIAMEASKLAERTA